MDHFRRGIREGIHNSLERILNNSLRRVSQLEVFTRQERKEATCVPESADTRTRDKGTGGRRVVKQRRRKKGRGKDVGRREGQRRTFRE